MSEITETILPDDPDGLLIYLNDSEVGMATCKAILTVFSQLRGYISLEEMPGMDRATSVVTELVSAFALGSAVAREALAKIEENSPAE